jgi:PAS domain-containing protein
METRQAASSALTHTPSLNGARAGDWPSALWRRLKLVRPSHLLVGFGSGLILIGLAATAAIIWQMRIAIVETTVEELSRLNLVLVSQMARTFQNTDLLLQTTAETYQRREAARDLDPQEMHVLMRERVTAMHGLIRGHAIAGPDGALLHSASRYPAGPLNPSDRSYFRVHRESPFAGLYISEPLTSRNNGEWGIYISRRLNDSQGGFAGVVFAGIDPAVLAEQFSALRLGAGSSISLLRSDGLILARSLDSPLDGQSVAGYGLFRDLRPGTDGLHGREAAPPLGRGPRIYSARYLPDLPLAIIISLPEDAALADWRRYALSASIGAAMATLTMMLLIGGLVRQIRRQEGTAAALEKSRRSLEMAQAVGHVGSWESSLRDGTQEWSAETFRIFGVDKAGWGGTIRDFLALVHPDDRAAVRAATVATVDRGQPYSIDHRLCRPDGAVRWVHVQADRGNACRPGASSE